MSDQRDDRFTPGPWEQGDWGPEYVFGFDGQIVADCRNHVRTLDQAVANAHRIVTAVNAHDALLAALREARKWLRCRSVACGTDGWQCKVCATKAIADAALKEFGQQSQIDEYADRIVSLESQVATLTRERDEARRQRDDWQSMVVVRNRNLDTYVEQLKRENQMSGGIFDVFERWRELNDKLDRLRAENAELRRVLEAVEWHGYPTLKVKHWCPSCCVGHPKYKHLADCALGRALGRPECGEGT